MKHGFLTLLTFVFISASIIFPQHGITVTGTIIEKESKKPLDNANVFLVSTTIGTRTDSKGHFIIKNIPYGSYQLMASYVGFQSQSSPVASYKDTRIELNFSLEQVSVKLGEVSINAMSPDEWKSNFKIFNREFIGETENAELTKIINPEVIEFSIDEVHNILHASSDSTIIVENRALGYKLFIILNQIDYDLNHHKYTYAYFPKFEELKPNSESEKETWAENRAKCYLSSMKYFFKSLFYKELENEGFAIYSGKLNNLLAGLGMWTSQDQFLLQYNRDSTMAEFTFDKCINVIKNKESILNFGNDRITIDKFGNLIAPNFVHSFRWWAKLRTADLLPFDYVYNK